MTGVPIFVPSFVLLMCVATNIGAQSSCRVLDPELGRTYKGECKDELANGYGEAAGAAEYKGGFRAGRKHGSGVKIWPSGDKYEGAFSDDMKHGTGRYIWSLRGRSAGEQYSGGYRNDMRDGQGTYEWPSGDRYIGAWRNDLPTGPMTPMMMARVIAQSAALQAMGTPGARVCRTIRFGIANRDLIRGDVVSVDAPFINVRIVDPGQQVHLLDDIQLERGMTVRARPVEWEPCG